MILRLPTLHHAVLTTAVVFLTISTSSWAKTPSEVRAACRAEGRPCVGLVLSGGGARGFAHVGVIKVLEELGVKIDVIAGTSMGSMVGGAYAAGFTAKALEDTVLEVDWSKMLAPRPQRDILSWRRKLDDYKSLPSAGKSATMVRRAFPMLLCHQKNWIFFWHEKQRLQRWLKIFPCCRSPLRRLQPILLLASVSSCKRTAH